MPTADAVSAIVHAPAGERDEPDRCHRQRQVRRQRLDHRQGAGAAAARSAWVSMTMPVPPTAHQPISSTNRFPPERTAAGYGRRPYNRRSRDCLPAPT